MNIQKQSAFIISVFFAHLNFLMWYPGFISLFKHIWTSLMAQLVRNLPAMWETWVRSLVWEDSLEKGKATHSSILAWRITWTISFMGLQRIRHDWVIFIFTHLNKYVFICFLMPFQAISKCIYVNTEMKPITV